MANVSLHGTDRGQASSAYSVNVNRTKTKKWVEAKPQNYDGDDWGVDEFEQDDEHDPESDFTPPVPSLPTKQEDSEMTAKSLPLSRPSNINSSPSNNPPITEALLQSSSPATSPHSTSTTAVPGSLKAPKSGDSSPHYQTSSSKTVEAEAALPSSQFHRDEARTISKSPPLTRPADIYRRMEMTREESKSESERHLHSSEPPLEDRGHVNQRTTGHSRDAAPAQVIVPGSNQNLSLSPKLPDVARMSAFGADMFTPASKEIPTGRTIAEDDVAEIAEITARATPSSPRTAHLVTSELDSNQAIGGTESDEKESLLEMQDEAALVPDQVSNPPHSYKPTNNTEDLPYVESQPTRTVSQSDEEESIKRDFEGTADENQLVASEHPISVVLPLQKPSPPNLTSRRDDLLPGVSTSANTESHDQEKVACGDMAAPTSQEMDSPVSTSSLVNDSDILSDEILRSLSPGQGTLANPLPASQADVQQAAPDSSYTLNDYDNYWAATSNKLDPISERDSGVAGDPALSGEVGNEAASSLLNQPEKLDELTPPLGDIERTAIRRKFSWENVEGQASSSSKARPAAQATMSPKSPTAIDLAVMADQASSLPLPTADDELPGESLHDRRAMKGSVDSNANALAIQGTTSAETSRQASSAGLESPSYDRQTTSESTAARTSSQTSQAPSTTFREILTLASSAERTRKFDEMRAYFASLDIGLDLWITSLEAQTMHLMNGSTAANADVYQEPAAGLRKLSSAAPQVGAQQPYYQQYLNASAPYVSTSPTSRPRRAGPQASSPGPASAFGNSGHQNGSKSKEFMQSAGKMGKGLLHKGRNKLRGGGDKNLH